MVDNLQEAFERATEKYLDQISSSDDEIAVEYLESESDSRGSKKKKNEETDGKKSKRKPMLVAQTDKKRERSLSEESFTSRRSDSVKPADDAEKTKKSKNVEKKSVRNNKNNKHEQVGRKGKKRNRSLSEDSSSKRSKSADSYIEDDYEAVKTKKTEEKNKKSPKSNNKPNKKEKNEKDNKKDKHVKESKEEKTIKPDKKPQKNVKSKKDKNNKKEKIASPIRKRSPSRSLSRSPPRSDLSSPPPSWPPSSPDSSFDLPSRKQIKKKVYDDFSDDDSTSKNAKQKKQSKIKELFEERETKHIDKKIKKDFLPSSPLSPKPKDKHNKLRETIEKLKAKSEIAKIKCEYDFNEDESPKENNDKLKKEKEKPKEKPKDKNKKVKKNLDLDEGNSTMDSTYSESKKPSKKKPNSAAANNVSSSNATSNNHQSVAIEALTLATEQTLKDINKWLDDTPKFSEFSSASNSPSYTGLDDFESISSKLDQDPKKKLDKPLTVKKDGVAKDNKRRQFRDPSKFFKRREVQRTIDRLQPGKSKGNLISNVPSVNKVNDELFPLGPLSKMKDTKNSLIVKTDTNAPKLSLGSVLDSFGKHKFVDDQKKEEEKVELKKAEIAPVLQDSNIIEEKKESKETVDLKETKEVINDDSGGGATPNLSAWFKAFGAPKMQPPVKKDVKPDGKENEEKPPQKVPIPDPSPSLDSPVPGGQGAPRQRRISTGSSMSERSSFSQDMDSPRVGIDERLAYPAPYPSPMHRSPSGASPVMTSPRPDVSPKSAAYPPFNGQMRVGFYQDTVSNKSSPDKSCSPRDNPQSPYPPYQEHVYTPNTTQSTYPYSNTPYYTHTPNYSSTNPTPPYNTEANSPSYYDTSKSLTDQYQAKSVQNYSANSPASNISSPASHPQHSPNIHSPNVHSPNVHSPNVHSPNVHSPNVHSPNVLSPNIHSPNVLSPNVHSPNINSPNVLSPNVHSQSVLSPGYQQEEPVKIEKIQPTQNSVFPVKKRVYTEAEQNQLRFSDARNADDIINRNLQMGEQLNLSTSTNNTLNTNSIQMTEKELPKYIHQNIPEPKQLSVQTSMDTYTKTQLENFKQQPSTVSPVAQQNIQLQQQNMTQQSASSNARSYPNQPSANPYAYNNEANYPLNIPSTRTLTGAQQELERKMDLSKYTNMGYNGPEVNFSRTLQQQYNHPEYTRNTLPSTTQSTATASSTNQTSQPNDMLRYSNPNVLGQMNYKNLDINNTLTNTQQAHSNYTNTTPHHQAARGTDVNTRRNTPQEASGAYKSSEVTVPRPTYNAPSLEVNQPLSLRGNIANLSHIVDRYNSDERALSGLQSTTASYYPEKGLSSPHMFNKPISTNTTGLPMFSQANMAAMQSQYQNIQATSTSMYNRQMNELQNPALMSNEVKAQNLAQATTQEKKSKKRKSKTAASVNSSDQQQTAANQGFQSYAGLKGNASMEPSAISLKTSSVVPGSAFNFGPTATGLSIGSSLYGDKETYPFLEDFSRSAPNYYMAAAAAAHHRSTPETNDKQTRAHQSSTPQSAGYPFLGAPQVRPSYPIAAPFISPSQAQLMDTSSPIYQHYLQAGVLNQGLLGPGPYPPGYHALSMRQPYDSMTRPSWL